MIATANNYKSKALSIVSAVLLGAASILGLQSCNSGGGSDTSTTVNVAGGSVVEGDTGTQSIIFTMMLSAEADSTTTVDYTTSDGTAVAGTDYTAKSGTLAFTSGSTTATVTVDVEGDTAFEFDETITLTLSNPVAAVLGATASANGVITNDDDAEPKGYFTGAATVNGITIGDFTGLANDGRLMMFSPSTNLLYDITLGTVTVTDFSGATGSTVDVYVDGNKSADAAVTVTGTTNESQIQGTFSGGISANAVVTFDLLFDTQNNRGATLARIDTSGGVSWTGNVYGFVTETGRFASDGSGSYVGLDENSPSCGYLGDFVIPDATINIYPMSHDIIENFGGCAFVSTPGVTPLYTGFASVLDDVGTNDKLVYAFANGSLSLFAIMTR